jgi:hypothetical protein
MEDEVCVERSLLTRRTALGGALLGALACAAPWRSFAAAVAHSGRALYAFPGEHSGVTALAATWPTSSRQSQVRVHAGSQSWSVQISDESVTSITRQYGCRWFSGRIVAEARGGPEIVQAVVMEAPSETLAGVDGVWAEQLILRGARHRIGSPFLAALVEEDRALAELYHATSPAEDMSVMQKEVARVIAARARRSGQIANPEAHGRRLAAALLPDVLHYNSTLPSGFTFAERNGLRPDEADAIVVDAILGATATAGLPARRFRLQGVFPYFLQAAAAA